MIHGGSTGHGICLNIGKNFYFTASIQRCKGEPPCEVCVGLVAKPCSILCNPRLLCPCNSAGKDTGVGCHFLLQSRQGGLRVSRSIQIETGQPPLQWEGEGVVSVLRAQSLKSAEEVCNLPRSSLETLHSLPSRCASSTWELIRNAETWSYGSFIPSFLRNLHAVFHSGCIDLYSYLPAVQGSSLFPHSVQHLPFVGFLMMAILTRVRWYLGGVRWGEVGRRLNREGI